MYGSLISTQTLGSTATSITFSSIPSSYTDLIITLSVRTDYANTSHSVYLQFNGDTTAGNYSYCGLAGTGTGSNPLSGNNFYYINSDDAQATANTFSSSLVTIPNYSGSLRKVGNLETVMETNAANAYPAIYSNVWFGTAAINSVTIVTSLGNFVAGTTVSLYGLTHF